MFLKVGPSSVHGRGCFTTRDIATGETVARGEVLVFPPEETELLLRTNLKNYVFFVRDGPTPEGQPYSAVAMSPISFCNHAQPPNCDFSVDESASEVVLTARRALAEGEEVTIDYGDYADKII